MLERRIPTRLACLRVDLATLLCRFVGETKMGFGETHDHAASMIMQPGLLVRAIVQGHDLQLSFSKSSCNAWAQLWLDLAPGQK